MYYLSFFHLCIFYPLWSPLSTQGRICQHCLLIMEFPQKSQWLSIKVFCIWRLTYLYFYLPLCMKALYSSKSGLFPIPWALHGFSRLCIFVYLLSLYGMAVILQIVVILVKEGPFQILHLLVKTFSCTFLFETVKYFLFLLLAASCNVPFPSQLNWAPGLGMDLLFLPIFSS